MILIEMKRNGKMVYTPGVDMAMQEYVREHIFLEDDILMPYSTSPQVQMGRYQNAVKEINRDYMEENDIKLSRRDTGGGAIYLDRGNTSFCYLFNTTDTDTDLNFKKLYQPVVDILHELGATEVEISGRNDLIINGKKISGAALTMDGKRIYGGHSLQLDVDVETMVNALTPNRKKIESKGIDSVRSRVESIRPHLDEEYQDLMSQEFHDLFTCKLLGVDSLDEAEKYVLTEEDWEAIDKRCEEKWLNPDWLYGENPKYEYTRDARIEGVGTFEVQVSVKKGKISDISIFGDFFGKKPIKEVEEALIGTPDNKKNIQDVLSDMDLVPYFNAQVDRELAELITS